MRQQIKLWNVIAVFIGGCLGGLARYGVGLALHDSTSMLGTLAVNVIGSFCLSLLTYASIRKWDWPDWLVLACGTGFIGAFTTFSTFILELVSNVAARPAYTLLIFGANLVMGMLAAALGYWCAQLGGERDDA
ncbi:CrcB family protein [Lacticaseibacillus pabuli]|uniref:Fluoride-specific ion channel FluC n=1 Tax=Lacticaseibacillus pabuli TaxID=3025672 RepID=A0ABY7WW63_9LACO|nr:CrcB family protein [Lacticaseibacillus sp. KACC 23028]WDF83304.1 CrcB family protein [Lacticaseibacillus sp. KACC 23028]